MKNITFEVNNRSITTARFTCSKFIIQDKSVCSQSDLRPATLLNKRLWHRCFPVNFAKFLRTTASFTHNNLEFQGFLTIKKQMKFQERVINAKISQKLEAMF